jgi:polysaccharide biosynthesis protein PslH
MKILMISSFLPFPLYSGGHIRLYNLIRQLSKKHEITLVCEKRPNQTERDVIEMGKICNSVLTVERKLQWSIKNIVKTGFSKNCFLVTGHNSSEMKKIIKDELEKNKYDLIHVETFYVMQNLPKTSLPIVLIEHNVEYLVYKRYVENASALLRPLLSIDILKLKSQEINFWKQATKLVAVSDAERKIMGRSDVGLVPNGVDLDMFDFKERQSAKTVLFIGDFSWIQNVNAVSTILNEIWPKIYAKNKNLKLWIVGRKIPENLKNIKAENVEFDENAPSKTEEIYAKADILLAPKYVGGGTSYKILEAMATGVVVVTTSLGAEGIVNKDSNEISISDSSEELAGLVLKLAEDKNLRIEQARRARKIIEEKYDWKIIAEKLDKVYNSVISK